MSLFQKYSDKSDGTLFVNFIENTFEKKSFKYLKAMEYTDKFVIEFKPTDNCNFNCSYCCFHDNLSPRLSEEQFQSYLEVLSNFEITKDEIFLFVYGGEPTMHPDLTDYVIRINQLFPTKKVRTLIQSNGLFWKVDDYKKNEEELRKHNINYVFSFSFHKEFSKYKDIVERVNYLLSIDRFDVLTYMITKHNLNQHISTIKILESLNIPVYVRTILQESEWFLNSEYKKYITSEPDQTPFILTDDTDKEHIFSFEDLTMRGYLNFKDYSCSAGVNSLLLSATGKIYRCDMDFLYDRDPLFDINKSTDPIWEKDHCLKCTHKFCSIYYGDKWK
jgi:sulfatase maturation enzyme AslB (radical SAM superfamily)